MKPNFALNFSDSSIALLHRTEKGWQNVGETPFDVPDLDDALRYLRKIALGLEPSGFTTKLVIPNSQILYTQIAATGPSEIARRDQIAAALEELTPYTKADLVFDYSGAVSPFQVAALARDTLSEAFEFAQAHQFNPVCFVAIPEVENFSGEPWFGLTPNADKWIPANQSLERDVGVINIVTATAIAPAPTPEPEPEPVVVAAAETAPQTSAPKPDVVQPVIEPAVPPAAQDSSHATATGPTLTISDIKLQTIPSEVEVSTPTQASQPSPELAVPAAKSDTAVPAAAPKAAQTAASPKPPTKPKPAPISPTKAIRAYLPPVMRPEYDEEMIALQAQSQPLPALKPRPLAPKPVEKPNAASLAAAVASIKAAAQNSAALSGNAPTARANSASASPLVARPIIAPAVPTKAPVPQRLAPPPQDAAESLAHTPSAMPIKPPAKKRSLGVILVAVLVLGLSIVAAWSALFLGSDRTAGPDAAASTQSRVVTDAPLPQAQAEKEATAIAAPLAAENLANQLAEPIAQDEIFLSTGDQPPTKLTSSELPVPQNLTEHPPQSPMPPPPVGTVYQYDEQGLLVPQKAGIPSPDGYTIFSGKPKHVPPARPAKLSPPPPEAPAAETKPEIEPAAAASEPELPLQSTTAEAAASTQTAPHLSASTAGLVPLAVASSQENIEELPPLAAQPNPELASKRPKLRPETLTAPSLPEDTAQAIQETPLGTLAFVSRRPVARPEHLNAPPLATETAQAEVSLASLNSSLLSISRRPAARPQGLIVPEANPNVDGATAAALRAAPKAPASRTQIDEDDEFFEPEVATRKTPNIPTRANVAQNATYAKAIPLSKLNLIGVYGNQNSRHALIRQSNGQYKKVKVGDKIDGGQIKAITQNEVRYQKGGRLLSLAMPQG